MKSDAAQSKNVAQDGGHDKKSRIAESQVILCGLQRNKGEQDWVQEPQDLNERLGHASPRYPLASSRPAGSRRWQRLGQLLRVAGVGVDLLADDLHRHLM